MRIWSILCPYRIFTRNKESREIHKKKGKVRPKFSLHRQMTSDLCLNIAYFNVNGFDYQSSWAIERIMQKEVYFDVFTLSHKWKFCIFSCAPGLWPSAQLYISLRHWLSDSVTEWLSDWVRKLKISVNIDARTLKFGMEHLWAHWLRFRENQFEGPCEDHVLAIKGPYFGHF